MPAEVPNISQAVDIDAGDGFACAVISDGSVWCWGTPNVLANELFVQPSEKARGAFKKVALGDSHACALNEFNKVSCWGAALAAGEGVPFETETPLRGPQSGSVADEGSPLHDSLRLPEVDSRESVAGNGAAGEGDPGTEGLKPRGVALEPAVLNDDGGVPEPC